MDKKINSKLMLKMNKAKKEEGPLKVVNNRNKYISFPTYNALEIIQQNIIQQLASF